MLSAVVLVNTESGSSQDQVIDSLKLIEGVEEAHALYGVYDLIIKIKALAAKQIDPQTTITATDTRIDL